MAKSLSDIYSKSSKSKTNTSSLAAIYKEEQDTKDFYESIGYDVTPETEKNVPYQSALAKTLQEGAITPAMHFANQALLNTPRAIMEQKGIKYPESESVAGNILAKGAGVAGMAYGLPAKLAGIGSKAVGKILPGAMGKVNRLRMMAQGAGASGLVGAAYSPEDTLDLKSRLKTGAISAGIGAIVGSFAKDAIAMGRGFKKIRIRAKQGGAKTDIAQNKLTSKQNYRKSMQVQKGNQDVLEKTLHKQVQGDVRGYGKDLKAYKKAQNANYKESLKIVKEDVGNSPAARQDFYEKGKSYLEGLKGTEAEQTKSFKAINRYVEKYKPIKTTDKFNFDEVFKGKKNIMDNYKGTGSKFEDNVLTEFNRQFNTFVDSKSPGFSVMQNEQSKVIKLTQEAQKLINPYNEYKSTSGLESLLKKRATGGKLTPSESTLLQKTDKALGTVGLKTDIVGRALQGNKEAIKQVAQAHTSRTDQLSQRGLDINKIISSNIVGRYSAKTLNRLVDFTIKIAVAKYLLGGLTGGKDYE